MNNFIERMSFESLEEVQAALTAPFDPQLLKKRQQWEFIPVERIRERMMKVLGVDGFDIEYSDVKHHNEDWITCNCTITVDFTKWGGRVKKVTQADGIQLKRHSQGNNQGLLVDIGNDYKSVMSGAFSKATQDLGIGLYIQFNKSGGAINGSYSSNSGGNSGGGNSNNGGNDNYEKLRKTVYACENTIGITEQVKTKLFSTMFPGVNVQQVMQNPTEQQLDAYKKVIQPVSLIIMNAKNAKISDERVLRELSQIFNRQIVKYTQALTLATYQTTNDLKSRLQNVS